MKYFVKQYTPIDTLSFYTVYACPVTLQAALQFYDQHHRQWGAQTHSFLL